MGTFWKSPIKRGRKTKLSEGVSMSSGKLKGVAPTLLRALAASASLKS
jgi:hypothetical protein